LTTVIDDNNNHNNKITLTEIDHSNCVYNDDINKSSSHSEISEERGSDNMSDSGDCIQEVESTKHNHNIPSSEYFSDVSTLAVSINNIIILSLY
jgi:hypothetical protein